MGKRGETEREREREKTLSESHAIGIALLRVPHFARARVRALSLKKLRACVAMRKRDDEGRECCSTGDRIERMGLPASCQRDRRTVFS